MRLKSLQVLHTVGYFVDYCNKEDEVYLRAQRESG